MHKICRIFFISFVTLFFLISMSIYNLAFAPSSSNIYQGIDVSRWQGNIDFTLVKNSGIQVVYIKSSEGKNYIDPYFEQNYTMAKANGLKVGFYHYVTARSTEEAKLQAIFFSRVIAGKSPDCKLAMDFENFGNLTINQINSISKVFLETLEKETGSEVLIYSNAYSASNIFSNELTQYPLWVANYNVSSPSGNDKWQTWVRLAVYKHRNSKTASPGMLIKISLQMEYFYQMQKFCLLQMTQSKPLHKILFIIL